MSKIAMNDATETVDVSVETPRETVDVAVKIVKDDDGYHCVLPDGTVSGVLKIIEDGRTLVLPKNPANRQYCAVKKADEGIAATGEFVLTVRTEPKRSLGSISNKLPNEKLIAYLPEDLQEEYKAIIARAIQARDAERAAAKKPLTEADKARAKVTKAIEQLKALGMSEADIKALIENAANNTEEVQA